MRQPHAAQDVWRFGELNVFVADDLHAVSPGVEEIEERARQRLDACGRQRCTDSILVVDHEPEVSALVGRLGPTLLQREKLVAEVDESRSFARAAQLEIEETAIECERLADIADLEGDVVHSDSTCFLRCRHGALRQTCLAEAAADVPAPVRKDAGLLANDLVFPGVPGMHAAHERWSGGALGDAVYGCWVANFVGLWGRPFSRRRRKR